ncbi:MAG: hypothetical protein GC165_07410 [Armatimonadetes bacterium]|nr:hypothetical protein [Armatimonadota bacterium]
MIHKNEPATDYELLLPFSGSETGLATAGLTYTPYLRTLLTEQWGDTGTGLNIAGEIVSNLGSSSHNVTLDSPVGSYASGSVAGLLSSAYLRIYITDYQLVVGSDCSYTVSWSAIDAYLSVNGGGESHVVSWGSYSHSEGAGAYDERENATIAQPIFAEPTWSPTWDCSSALVPDTDVEARFNQGGYRYKDALGSWVYDPVTFDTGTAGGSSCDCYYDLPSIGATVDQWSYTVDAAIKLRWRTYDEAVSTFDCPCLDSPASMHGTTYRRHREGRYESAGPIYIKDKRINLGQEQVGTSWRCSDTDGIVSSSDTEYTTPSVWECKSTRSVEVVSDNVFCVHVIGGNPCIFGFVDPSCYPTGTSYHCTYLGTRAVSYTTKPPCEAPTLHGVWNLSTRDHRFLISFVDGEGAKVRWWTYTLPRGDTGLATVSADAQCEQCRVYDDNRLRIYAVIGKNSSGTLHCYRSWSDDGGKTWADLEDMGITNGRFPTGSSSPLGDRLEAAFVYDSGTSGPGTIKVLYRSAGDTSFSGPATCKDSSGANLSFDDTSFHIHFGQDTAQRIILSALIHGETSPSSWFSTDALSGGMTFTRFS